MNPVVSGYLVFVQNEGSVGPEFQTSQSAFVLFCNVLVLFHWVGMNLAVGNLDVLMFAQPKWRDLSKNYPCFYTQVRKIKMTQGSQRTLEYVCFAVEAAASS